MPNGYGTLSWDGVKLWMPRVSTLLLIAGVVGGGFRLYYNEIEEIDKTKDQVQRNSLEIDAINKRAVIFGELYTTRHTELETRIGDLKDRFTAQAARLTSQDSDIASLHTELNAVQGDTRQSFRDQLATDRTILEEIGRLRTDVAGISATLALVTRITGTFPPVVGGTSSPQIPKGDRP